MNLRRLAPLGRESPSVLSPRICGFDWARFSGVKEEAARLRERNRRKPGDCIRRKSPKNGI